MKYILLAMFVVMSGTLYYLRLRTIVTRVPTWVLAIFPAILLSLGLILVLDNVSAGRTILGFSDFDLMTGIVFTILMVVSAGFHVVGILSAFPGNPWTNEFDGAVAIFFSTVVVSVALGIIQAYAVISIIRILL